MASSRSNSVRPPRARWAGVCLVLLLSSSSTAVVSSEMWLEGAAVVDGAMEEIVVRARVSCRGSEFG